MKKTDIKNYILAKKETLLKHGYFLKYCSFYKIQDDIAFCITFTNASRIYCDYYFMPLFIKSDYQYLTYGDRIEIYTQRLGNKLSPLCRNDTGEGYEEWMENVFEILNSDIIPFFESISNADEMLSTIINRPHVFKKFISCPDFNTLILKIYLEIYTKKTNDCTADLILAEKYLADTYDKYQLEYKSNKLNTIKEILNNNEKEIENIMNNNIDYTKKACGFKKAR